MPLLAPFQGSIYDLARDVDEYGIDRGGELEKRKGGGGGRGSTSGGGRSSSVGTGRGSSARTGAGGWKGGSSRPSDRDGGPHYAGGGGGVLLTSKPHAYSRPQGSAAGPAGLLAGSVIIAGVTLPLALLDDEDTGMGFCDGLASLPQTLDDCTIANVPATQYANDTMVAIADWRAANSTTSSIDHQAGIGKRFQAILDSDCSLPPAVNKWVTGWKDYIEEPDGIFYAENDVERMCTEDNPRLSDTAITSAARDEFLAYGEHIAEIAKQFTDKGCKYTGDHNMTQVVFDLGNATRSSFENPDFRDQAHTNFSDAKMALFDSKCEGFKLKTKDDWHSLNKTGEALDDPKQITAVQYAMYGAHTGLDSQWAPTSIASGLSGLNSCTSAMAAAGIVGLYLMA